MINIDHNVRYIATINISEKWIETAKRFLTLDYFVYMQDGWIVRIVYDHNYKPIILSTGTIIAVGAATTRRHGDEKRYNIACGGPVS